MKFGSVCSGIEAASTAWNPIGWEAAWFAEIEPFPCAVLKHHYPNVPNYGDMTKFKEWPDEPIDLLCGGTPCQSFSVAGLRKGLDDPRGNLMLTYLAIAAKYRPKWLVWENVPGVLSSNGGRDFASFLHGMGECGYGFAYRVLDAQYFGVPQRRRRVFVVGCLGDWRSAAAVLFERDSLQGNPAPSRETGQEVAGTIAARAFGGNNQSGPIDVATSRLAHNSATGRMDFGSETFLVTPIALAENTIGRQPENGGNGDGFTVGGPMYTLNATGVHEVAAPVAFAQNSRDEVRLMNGDGQIVGALSAEPGMKQTCYIAQPMTQYGPIAGSLTARHDSSPCADRGMNVTAHTVPTLVSNGDAHSGFRDEHGLVPVAFGVGESPDVGHCLRSGASKADKHESTTYVAQTMQVRRLTPVECERLMGFPDGYTNIPWRGKPESPDGPRYKALGNSWAVPVVRWIGERINQVEAIK